VAVKATESKASEPAAKPAVESVKPAVVAADESAPETATPTSDCVVDAPYHVGRAVNGKVCSYHAMQYKADGTPRQ
jgi:hypothetical protein